MNRILFDGAFGTYYRQKGGVCDPCEAANISEPGLVSRIHKSYLEAGAQAIKTNTFNANPVTLPDTYAQVIKAGCSIAREAAGPFGARVFADIGGGFSTPEAAEEGCLLAAKLFCAEGMTDFLFETQFELLYLLPSIQYIRENVNNACIAVCFAVSQDGYGRTGRHCKALVADALSAGADMAGLNCSCGPVHMVGLAKELPLSSGRIIIMPNAGYPSEEGGRLFYRDNAEYFSKKLAELLPYPVSLGGCCGTTPAHIAALSSITSAAAPRPFKALADSPAGRAGIPPLKKGSICVEIDPPRDTDISYFMTAAAAAVGAGADIITVADSPLANPKADSFMLAAKLKRELGTQVLPHLACRDRNKIATKSALLGARIEGIDRILAITGDRITADPRADLKNVFNFNSQSLISFVTELNGDVFADAPMAVYAALNTSASNFDAELTRALKKARSGASAFLTQPLFSAASIENCKRAVKELPVPVLAGIMPVASYKNALFLNNEVSGIEIPEEVVETLRGSSAQQVREISGGLCKKTLEALGPCGGYYIMTPLKKIEFVTDLIRYIKERGAID